MHDMCMNLPCHLLQLHCVCMICSTLTPKAAAAVDSPPYSNASSRDTLDGLDVRTNGELQVSVESARLYHKLAVVFLFCMILLGTLWRVSD